MKEVSFDRARQPKTIVDLAKLHPKVGLFPGLVGYMYYTLSLANDFVTTAHFKYSSYDRQKDRNYSIIRARNSH